MNAPATLTARRQWVLWRAEGEKGSKVPYTIGGQRKASSTDPRTWAPFADTLRELQRHPERYSGLGYVFSGDDGLVGVDLDDCRDPDTGEIADWARSILDSLDTYAEISPSGTGVKAWVVGTLPESVKTAHVEIYPRARYFAVTGWRLEEYPDEPQEAQEALDALADHYRRRDEPAAYATLPPSSDSHRERWARRVLGSAVAKTIAAVDGQKHNELLGAARLAAGAMPYLNEDEIERTLYDAIRLRADDPRGALKTIRDGIRMGALKPLEPPATPTTQPLVVKAGRPHCPQCGTRALRSRWPYPGTDEPGWYCPECKGSMKWPADAFTPAPVTTPEGATPPTVETSQSGAPEPFHRTDLGNAKRLVARHGDDLRFVPAWQAWLVWNGRHWQKDEDGEIHRRAKQTVASIYGEAAEETDLDRRKEIAKWAARSESRGRLEAMVALAQTEDGIPVGHEQLDGAAYLLAVENGTVDLHTGALLPHDRAHLITKALPVVYDPAATCPIWDAFLRRVLAEDGDLIAFIQRAVGYTLTADTREQCLFFLYGVGRNGKSTFIEALLDLLGPYGQKAPTEMLMARPMGGGIPNDVAQLPGTRYVVTAETEEGRRLNESLAKDLTGGDRMTARFMRAEFFSFKPTHKLWMYGNHKPVIRGTDNGIWRRIRAVPFTVTLADAEVDLDLPAKLRGELPGILAWAVRGCLQWQTDGLGVASAVVAATDAYRAEMDVLGAFLEARCVIADGARVKASLLYAAYKEWAEAAGEFVMSLRRFGGQLTERGFGQHKDRNGNIQRTGIGLLSAQPPPNNPPDTGPPEGVTEEPTEERTMTEDFLYIPTIPLSHAGNIGIPPSSSVSPSIVRQEESPDEEEAPPTAAAALVARLKERRNGST